MEDHRTTPITDSERSDAVDALTTTQRNLHQTLAGLSADQLTYKPAADRWSIADCVEHIALVEMGLYQAVQAGMQAPAAPEKRAELTLTDAALVAIVRNRAALLTAPEPTRPTSRWRDTAAALQAFDQQRSQTIQYVQTVPDDLRTHYFSRFSRGALDLYQTLLLMAMHVDRHCQQIDEVKMSPGFPQ